MFGCFIVEIWWWWPAISCAWTDDPLHWLWRRWYRLVAAASTEQHIAGRTNSSAISHPFVQPGISLQASAIQPSRCIGSQRMEVRVWLRGFVHGVQRFPQEKEMSTFDGLKVQLSWTRVPYGSSESIFHPKKLLCFFIGRINQHFYRSWRIADWHMGMPIEQAKEIHNRSETAHGYVLPRGQPTLPTHVRRTNACVFPKGEA